MQKDETTIKIENKFKSKESNRYPIKIFEMSEDIFPKLKMREESPKLIIFFSIRLGIKKGNTV